MAVQCPRRPLPNYCRSEEHLVAECPTRRRAVAREKSSGTGTRVGSSEAETHEREWAATTESGVWGEPEPHRISQALRPALVEMGIRGNVGREKDKWNLSVRNGKRRGLRGRFGKGKPRKLS